MELYIYITNETIYPTSPDNLASNAVAWLLHETQPSVAPLPSLVVVNIRRGSSRPARALHPDDRCPPTNADVQLIFCKNFLSSQTFFDVLKKSNFLTSQTFLYHRHQYFQKTFSTTFDQ